MPRHAGSWPCTRRPANRCTRSPSVPAWRILSLQEKLATRLEELLADEEILHAVIRAYVPRVLLDQLGTKRILSVLERPELKPYRDAIVTKKIASMALYRHAAEWEPFLHRLEQDFGRNCSRATSAASSPGKGSSAVAGVTGRTVLPATAMPSALVRTLAV